MWKAVVAITGCLAASAAAAQDIKGGKDHPLLPRYEGSEIIRYDTDAFVDHPFLIAPVKGPGGLEKSKASAETLEGRRTRIIYRGPVNRSSLEVFRNYEAALKKAGFETVFSCAREECGGRHFSYTVSKLPALAAYDAEQRYAAAKLARAEGDVYASVYVIKSGAAGGPDKDRPMIQVEIMEMKPMEAKMVVVDSSAMERDIAAKGRVAMYGILFDFDKDTMRADSKPQLDEIAKLLKGQPGLKVLIVGHTDAKGAFDYNRSLSERRAASIVAALVRDYAIDRARLTPLGVGMAAPVSTNRTEQGRSLNRRVELVDAGT